jgi:hypothetical protein
MLYTNAHWKGDAAVEVAMCRRRHDRQRQDQRHLCLDRKPPYQMYLLGLAQPVANHLDLVPIYITVPGTFWGFFIHANLKWRFGLLELLVSSPAFHHWHHTNDGPERINKNYTIFSRTSIFYLPISSKKA